MSENKPVIPPPPGAPLKKLSALEDKRFTAESGPVPWKATLLVAVGSNPKGKCEKTPPFQTYFLAREWAMARFNCEREQVDVVLFSSPPAAPPAIEVKVGSAAK